MVFLILCYSVDYLALNDNFAPLKIRVDKGNVNRTLIEITIEIQ